MRRQIKSICLFAPLTGDVTRDNPNMKNSCVSARVKLHIQMQIHVEGNHISMKWDF